MPDTRRPEREKLVQRLNIHSLWRDAWNLEAVKHLKHGNLDRFMRSWDTNVHWIPNWKYPQDFFFWPETAVTLDPLRITGKKRLLNEFGSYTKIGPDTAIRLMDSVPVEIRTSAWFRVRQEIDSSFDETDADIADIRAMKDVAETTKKALIDARRGQGEFRAQVMAQWDGACAVTGCKQSQVLRASHIKPWKSSSHAYRLNPRNGLLLSANLDALFDRGLVSFKTSGQMLISNEVTLSSRDLLGLPAELRRSPDAEEDGFLDHHRKHVFRGNGG